MTKTGTYSRRKPVAFQIDQSMIDAPAFPRSQDWWIGFLPMWVNVVEVRPDGTVFLAVDGRQGPALEGFLTKAARGRLAQSVQRVEAPPEVPASRWDVWLAERGFSDDRT